MMGRAEARPIMTELGRHQMMFRCHQRWVLWRMDHRLRRSDPHLAAMLAIFAKLYAREAIPGRRPAGWLGGLVLRLLARPGETVAKAAARLRDCAAGYCEPSRPGGGSAGLRRPHRTARRHLAIPAPRVIFDEHMPAFAGQGSMIIMFAAGCGGRLRTCHCH